MAHQQQLGPVAPEISIDIIEQMLAKGMTEEQIIAALTPVAPKEYPPAFLPEEGSKRYYGPPPRDRIIGGQGAKIGAAPLGQRLEDRSVLESIVEFMTGIPSRSDEGPGPFETLLVGAPLAHGAAKGAPLALDAIKGLIGKIPFSPPARLARAQAVNAWANQEFPYRLTNPNRLLPEGSAPAPDFPHGYVDSIPESYGELPPQMLGPTTFTNKEAFPETTVFGNYTPTVPYDQQKRAMAIFRALSGSKN